MLILIIILSTSQDNLVFFCIFISILNSAFESILALQFGLPFDTYDIFLLICSALATFIFKLVKISLRWLYRRLTFTTLK